MKHLEGLAITPQRPLVGALAGTIIGEYGVGRQVKAELRQELDAIITDFPEYQGVGNLEGARFLEEKLTTFRPRRIGALTMHAHLSGKHYDELLDQEGLDKFFIFWVMGANQDDFIDQLPKHEPGQSNLSERQAIIQDAIFGDKRLFYQAAELQLRQHIATLPTKESIYLNEKVDKWYDFLIDQEAAVLQTPMQELTFDFCKQYREDQNLQAGSTLVALLNGRRALGAIERQIEPVVASFSFMTQMIDDIADTVEDLTAERPSFAVGALMDEPQELAAVQAYRQQQPITKVLPHQFAHIAPQAYKRLHETFKGYAKELSSATGSTMPTHLVHAVYHAYPALRQVIYKVAPKYAKF